MFTQYFFIAYTIDVAFVFTFMMLLRWFLILIYKHYKKGMYNRKLKRDIIKLVKKDQINGEDFLNHRRRIKIILMNNNIDSVDLSNDDYA